MCLSVTPPHPTSTPGQVVEVFRVRPEAEALKRLKRRRKRRREKAHKAAAAGKGGAGGGAEEGEEGAEDSITASDELEPLAVSLGLQLLRCGVKGCNRTQAVLGFCGRAPWAGALSSFCGR